jgi:beta-glucanase (GH16 family)
MAAAGEQYVADAIAGEQAKNRILTAQVTDLQAQLDATDPGYLTGWGTPAWRDEFDGTTLDLVKWNARDNIALSYDEAIIYRANSVVNGDGFLHQKIERVASPVFRSGHTRYFTTGYLDTNGKFAQRYGRWEIRAKLPLALNKSATFWPAFWLRDSVGNGECDVMEAYGTPQSLHPTPSGQVSMTMHESTNHEAGTVKIENKVATTAVNAADGQFHIFAVEWTPTGFRFLVDGVERWFPKTASYPWFETAFPGGLNIRMNCQTGSAWHGFYDPTKPEQSVVPAEMTVDYVRVWKYTA